jgi:hypothetical protein
MGKDWLNLIQRLFVASDHDGECAVACADVAAGDRRIERGDVFQ